MESIESIYDNIYSPTLIQKSVKEKYNLNKLQIYAFESSTNK
jgi:hypothetical protein